MFDLAKLIRTDRKLVINETSIRQQVARVMDLEKDIANVSTLTFSSICFRKYAILFFEKLRTRQHTMHTLSSVLARYIM